jgi:hypothetical protein
MGRASRFTWSGSPFAYGISTGNSLSVLFVYGLSIGKPFVVVVGNVYGANLGTFSTACTLGKVYISRRLFYLGGKISRIAFKFYKFGIGKKFYI